MNINLDKLVLKFSSYNPRTQSFDKVLAEKPLEDMSDSEANQLIEDSSQISVFVDDCDKADEPAILQRMEDYRSQLEWRGEADSSSYQYVSKKTGEVVKGTSFFIQRDPSRKITSGSFFKRLAGQKLKPANGLVR